MYSQTHKNVEQANILYQTPEVFDIVECSGQLHIVTQDCGENIYGDRVIATTNLETGYPGCPFAKNVKVIWKENANHLAVRANEYAMLVRAQQIADQFQLAMELS